MKKLMFRRRRRRRKKKTKTKDENGVDRKEQKKVKKNFKTNVLVPNKRNVQRWRHRSGYSLTFSTAGCLVYFVTGRTGSVLPWKPSAFSRKAPLTTENVLPSTQKTAIFRLSFCLALQNR